MRKKLNDNLNKRVKEIKKIINDLKKIDSVISEIVIKVKEDKELRKEIDSNFKKEENKMINSKIEKLK